MTTTLPKVALITGITGQDGAYLAELLLEEGYAEWTRRGIKRRSSLFNTDRIDHLYQDRHDIAPNTSYLKLHHGDLTDSTNLIRIIQRVGRNKRSALRRMSASTVLCASLSATLRPVGTDSATNKRQP